jgi:hypothetical protein
MAQANLIIIRIRTEETERFEQMFHDEEVPIWRDLRETSGLRHASLTKIAFGTDADGAAAAGYREYGIYAEFDSMAGHTAHDDDQRFNAFLKEARKLQPKGPSVWGGNTVATLSDE